MARTGEKKSSIKNSVGRIILYALAVILQFVLFVAFVTNFENQYPIIAVTVRTLALAFALYVNSQDNVAAMRLVWIIILLIAPIFGVMLYLIFRFNTSKHLMRKKLQETDASIMPILRQGAPSPAGLEKLSPAKQRDLEYINNFGPYPSFSGTKIKYYANQNDCYSDIISEVKSARKYVYMEYHAIEMSKSFEPLHEALKDRAAAGLDVRVLYDDIGSFVFIDKGFIKLLESEGIKCQVFNRVIPFVSAFVNNRDHRKITAIDDRVGFTGGFNIADEYFNLTSPYGVWKDNGLRLDGPAVMSLKAMFAEMWNFADIRNDSERKMLYVPGATKTFDVAGICAPYADSPLDDEPLGENVYINMLNRAERYCWFMTPYLVLSDELKREILIARKRGVDVRIITPGIPDKKTVYSLTRSYYYVLAEAGVRIFEFTPGFIHSKVCLVDDNAAVVGTINLDFRSLYHHFENAVLMYDCDCIKDIKADFDETFPACREVTEAYSKDPNFFVKTGKSILRLIAPIA